MSGVAIGLDLGTSGVRAALVDAARAPLAIAAAAIAPERRRDPEAWWQAAAQALDALRDRADLGTVRALAVDGTSGTVLAVNAAGTPLGPASLYNDRADPALVARIAAAAPSGSAAHGATSPAAKLLGLQDVPGIAWLLHEADWLAGRLCGRFGMSDANNALKTGYDPVAQGWPDWLAAAGAKPALLPAVQPPGTAVAPVLPAVATRFGLAADAVVAAGTTDGCAAFLATGATRAGDGVTSLGTTLTLKLLSDAPVFAPTFGIYSHRLGARWLPGGASNSGGAALARHFDAATLARLSARIDPARDSGLDYYPLPGPGERFPIADPALPPREAPRPADEAAFLHGLLEGIARIEALGYQRLADLGAPPLRSVRTVGGGAANVVWTALRARILGVPMLPARSQEAAVGTAGLALQALA
ncbi:MAG: FGGY-family carbohydrate kinase [Rhodospirillales bacterium]|nr:FGGY-family carbohydrate kinase [Rhodospirillales bacterium]